MELLPILYALLAAITGIHADDRSTARADRPVAAASAAPCAMEEARFVAVARAISERPVAKTPKLAASLTIRPLGQLMADRLFDIASFAVRRE